MNALIWFERNNKVSWLITLLIAVTIFYFSSKTFSVGTKTTNYLSFAYHLFAFFYLAFFLLISLMRGDIKSKYFIIGILIAILYSISDEIHQYFIPGRNAAILDVLTNSAGILLAGTLYSFRLRKNH